MSGDPHRVDAGADDLDRLGKLRLVGRFLVGARVLLAQVRLEREAHAAPEVQPELEPPLGLV
jgi:hypothetical protein